MRLLAAKLWQNLCHMGMGLGAVISRDARVKIAARPGDKGGIRCMCW